MFVTTMLPINVLKFWIEVTMTIFLGEVSEVVEEESAKKHEEPRAFIHLS